MDMRHNLSFEELGDRELLKPAPYWLGLAATVITAAWGFHKAWEEATAK